MEFSLQSDRLGCIESTDDVDEPLEDGLAVNNSMFADGCGGNDGSDVDADVWPLEEDGNTTAGGGDTFRDDGTDVDCNGVGVRDAIVSTDLDLRLLLANVAANARN